VEVEEGGERGRSATYGTLGFAKIKRGDAWKRRGSTSDDTVRVHESVVAPVGGKESPGGGPDNGGVHKNRPEDKGTGDVLTFSAGFKEQTRNTEPVSDSEKP